MIIRIIFNDLSILKWFQLLTGVCWEAQSHCTGYIGIAILGFCWFVCLFNINLEKWWELVVRSGRNFAVWGFLAWCWPWWKHSGLRLHWGSKQSCPSPHSKRAKPQATGQHCFSFFPIDKWYKVLFRHGSGNQTPLDLKKQEQRGTWQKMTTEKWAHSSQIGCIVQLH